MLFFLRIRAVAAATGTKGFRGLFAFWMGGARAVVASGACELDPLNTTGSGVADLSNSNHTYIHSAVNVGAAASRSVTSITAGKVYVEFVITKPNNSGDIACGISNGNLQSGTGIPSTGMGQSISDNGMGVDASNSTAWINGNPDQSIKGNSNLITGDIVSMALDKDTNQVWFRCNGGDWNGVPTADPVASVGGISLSGFGTFDNEVYATVYTNEISNGWTINLGGSAFTYTAPTGFSGWCHPGTAGSGAGDNWIIRYRRRRSR